MTDNLPPQDDREARGCQFCGGAGFWRVLWSGTLNPDDKIECGNCRDEEPIARAAIPPMCGPSCADFDITDSTCEAHGPTKTDRIVERVTDGFRRDLKRIMA